MLLLARPRRSPSTFAVPRRLGPVCLDLLNAIHFVLLRHLLRPRNGSAATDEDRRGRMEHARQSQPATEMWAAILKASLTGSQSARSACRAISRADEKSGNLRRTRAQGTA